MLFFWIILLLILVTALFGLITSYVCFYRVFYSKREKVTDPDFIPIPEGDIYEKYRDDMIEWIKRARSMPHKKVSITSFDGLTLRGRYYEYAKGAPIEILFHGYKGSAERDLSGGVLRCAALGRSALIVDHRASGESDGRVITFGVKESRDCLDWINFVLKNIDSDAKIILTGISMGAATVMSVADKKLPKNVIGVLADCGYSSSEAIIGKVVDDMNLPSKILMPFIKLGARIFGNFKLDEVSPIEALKKSNLPVIFFHGDTDAYVPYEMSVDNYNSCASKKRLVTIKGAGHGLAFPTDPEKYLRELKDFFASELDA